MPSDPWIPRADDKFRPFAVAFCTNIADHPPGYMMTTGEAAFLVRCLNQFIAAYSRATNELTRTKQTIADKDDARSILENLIRKQAAFIRANDGIPDGEKLAIGVRPRNIAHHKRTCPNVPPLLQFIGSLPGIDQLAYYHSDTPESKAKPYGAARLELWRAYTRAGEPLPKVSDALLVGSFTQSKMIVEQDLVALAQGLSPTYWARWAGYSDNKGPNVSAWSIPVSMASAAKANASKKIHRPPQRVNSGAEGAEGESEGWKKVA